MRVELPGMKRHPASINDATVVKDFYTIETESGDLSDFFERQFSEVERPAAAALSMLLQDDVWPMKGEHRFALATWIALQYLRTERVRDQQTEMNAQFIRLIVGVSGKEALRGHIERHEGRAIAAGRLNAEWDELTRPEGPTIRPDVRKHLEILAEMLPETALSINRRQWTVNIFERKRLMTSDHPVSLHASPDRPSWRGVGTRNAGAYVLPLSRTRSLTIGASPELPDLRVPGNTRMFQAVNRATALAARRCVYWHPDDDQALKGFDLPIPRGSEIDQISNHNFNEAGLAASSSLDDAEDFDVETDEQTIVDEEPGIGLSDIPWPIPGRVSTIAHE